MTLAEAIDTLRKHNAWRTGETSDFTPNDLLPSKITEAIRLVCDAAARWEYVKGLASCSGLHMDGTSDYRLGRYIARAKSIEEAVDKRMESDKR